jgi:hypothetical protein
MFQSLYEAPSSLLGYLPFTVEWNAVALVLLLAGVVSPLILPVAVVPFAITLALAAATAARARIDPHFGGFRARALVALLTWLGPLVRGLQRYLWRARGLAQVERVEPGGPRQAAKVDLVARTLTLRYWSERGHEKEALLGALMEFLIPRKYLITVDPGWNRWDLEIYRGIWSKARVTAAVENHGGQKRLINVRGEIRLTRVAQLAVGGLAFLAALGVAFRVPEVAAVCGALGLVIATVVVTDQVRLARIVHDSCDLAGIATGLHPIGGHASSGGAPDRDAA